MAVATFPIQGNAPRSPHRFSVDEYEQMIKFGILTENDRVELIRGEIVEKMTIGERHAAKVNRSNRVFSRKVGDRAIVSVQNPIILADSEPEPDITLLAPRADEYETSKPRANDVLLLTEVSDSSLNEDRNVKGPLFAENGIGEYWIVNLPDDCLEVYRSPQPDGTYADKRILRRGDQVEILALPGIKIDVADLL